MRKNTPFTHFTPKQRKRLEKDYQDILIKPYQAIPYQAIRKIGSR